MSDLISRDAVLKMLFDQRDAAIETSNTYGDLDPLDQDEDEIYAENLDYMAGKIEKLPTITPQVVCNISGGLLQGASATHKVDVYALDYDLDDCTNEEKIVDPNGQEARFGQDSAAIDPEWVQKVIDAPLMSDMVECANCDWFGSVDDLNEIENLTQRVGPGETMPAGECPECGCLAHLMYPEDDQ